MTTEALHGPQGPERRHDRSQTPKHAPEAATDETSGAHGASEASGPVAELRAAAAKLRNLVHNATPTTMHPAVGGMLAGWLHMIADVIEAQIVKDSTDRRAVDANGAYALRIARLINGETSKP